MQWQCCYTSLTQHLQYNSTNQYTYLIQKVVNFSLHSCQSGVKCLSYWKSTCSFLQNISPVTPQATSLSSLFRPSSIHYKITRKLLAALPTFIVSLTVQLRGHTEVHTLTQMCLKLAIHDFIMPFVRLLLKAPISKVPQNKPQELYQIYTINTTVMLLFFIWATGFGLN